MLYIYIPALIALLNIDSIIPNEIIQADNRLHSSLLSLKMLVHDHSLKKLTEIGPKYPDEFKQIMASNLNYSESLKKAIHHQNRRANMSENDSNSLHSRQSEKNDTSKINNYGLENQTIKLKVDFSNYR